MAPKEILIFFDKIKYKFTSIVKAVDICFKIYQVFNLEYPPAAFVVWSFIQSYFYKITTKFNVNNLSVTLLKSKLDAK